MSNALIVKDLCKTYVVNKRQNHVLKNVSLSIAEGEMVAIMGPSGSGKTTLLYTASGMDQMTSGSSDFFGRDISKMKPKEVSELRLSEMGFVFQQMYMLKNLSVVDNILLPAYQSKSGKSKKARRDKDERSRELMHKMGIAEIATNDITETSGGQLQRACICRSLINHPKMIFADEPTGSLNKQASSEVMAELLRVNREGTTILLVTHDARIAAKCDRVLYLIDGQISGDLKQGKYEGEQELRERERNLNNWLLDRGW
ncbi:MAG: ABC transporter ATP-binding protein [Lachnospiraceae bacterium]|nr:ABC transporter ATP-binding protein [Lachnospiraceae bacterium]